MASYGSLCDSLYLQIFQYVDYKDLLSLSDVNKRSRKMVLADRRIYFYSPAGVRIDDLNAKNTIWNNYYRVKLGGMSIFLTFLRLYGSKIRCLFINFKNSTREQVYAIFHYINRYCVCLRDLTIKNLRHSPGRTIKRSFTTIKHLYFEDTLISAKFCHLSKWFPNLQQFLVHGDSEFQLVSALETNFKCLKWVTISTYLKNFDLHNFKKLNPNTMVEYY